MHNLERFLGSEPSDGIYCYSHNVVSDVRFPEELVVMEDYFFRKRVLAKQPRIGYVKSIVVHHRPQSVRWLITRALRYGGVVRKMKGEHRLSPAVLHDYVPLAKRNRETIVRVELGFLEPTLFLPFMLLKYVAFAIGYAFKYK
jgi:hypothetical protein